MCFGLNSFLTEGFLVHKNFYKINVSRINKVNNYNPTMSCKPVLDLEILQDLALPWKDFSHFR